MPKMAETYESCFDFAFRYTYFSFLPPFASRGFWLGLLPVFINFQWALRAFFMITEEGKRDVGIYYMVLQSIQLTVNAFIFLLHEKYFGNYANRINKFLAKNKINPFNSYGTTFSDIWNKNKPVRFTKWYFWFQVLFCTVWIIMADYELIFYVEKSSETPWNFYSPLIDRGLSYKLLHAVFDSIMMISTMVVAVQADIVLVAFLSFLKCQFIYLKLLLDEIFLKSERSDETNKEWIEQHVQVLNLSTHLNDLLRPHIMIKYLGQVIAVISICVALSEKKSNLSFEQRVTEATMVLPMFLILGYQCSFVEGALKVHNYMYENLLQVGVVIESSKENHFLRMLILRSQTPIQMSDYGFFNMCLKDFHNLVTQTYGFYSSILSIATG